MKNAFQVFYQNDVIPALDRALKEVNEIYQLKSGMEVERFQQQFRKICVELKKYITVTGFQPAFIYFNLLRTRLIRRDYQYAVYVYDELHYLKDGVYIGDIDVSFLFQPYDFLWDELLTESKKYFGKVSFNEVRDLMLSLSSEFHEYVVEFLRVRIKKAVEIEEYMSIEREGEIGIASGEFFEPCDLIYLENAGKREIRLKKKLKKLEKRKWSFKDFRGMDLEGMILSDCDFGYADFYGSKLSEVKFDGCLLDGTRFERVKLRGASFIRAIIDGADFTEADLQGASFDFCSSSQELNSTNDWRSVGALGVSFQNANLKDANFCGAVIVGGDFIGANLDSVRFDRAFLMGSYFSKELVLEGTFTEEQQKQIVMI